MLCTTVPAPSLQMAPWSGLGDLLFLCPLSVLSGLPTPGSYLLVEITGGPCEYDAIRPGGWLPAETWPDLWTARVSPACALLAGKVTVAAAGSVDIIYLDTKAVARGADMLLARRHFHLAAIGEEPYIRLLAVGGDSGVSALSQVEWYDDDGGVWEKAVASLRTGRSHSGAVMVTPEMVCTAECSEDNCPEQGKLYTWANMMSSLSTPIQSQMQRGP